MTAAPAQVTDVIRAAVEGHQPRSRPHRAGPLLQCSGPDCDWQGSDHATHLATVDLMGEWEAEG